jgi:hypothetical protein
MDTEDEVSKDTSKEDGSEEDNSEEEELECHGEKDDIMSDDIDDTVRSEQVHMEEVILLFF